MRRRVAHALDALDRVDGTQEIGELRPVLSGAEIAPVRVHVLAEQGDLDDAVARHLFDLVHDVAHAAADLATAHGGHDAERAGVVAADLDRHPRRVLDVAPGRKRRRVRGVLLEDLEDRSTGTGAGEQVGGVRKIVGSEDDVDVPGPLLHETAIFLGEAPAHCDLEIGPAILQRLQVAERPVELVVGVLTDAAGVEDDDVGFLQIVGRLHAVRDQQPGDALRVVLVHLAPEGAHEEPTRLGGARVRGGAAHGGQCTARLAGADRLLHSARHGGRGEPGLTMDVTAGALILAVLAALIGASVQGSIGFGMNLVIVPVLALVLPEALPATAVLIGFPISLDMVRHEHHAIDRTGIGWIILGRVPGTLLGAWVVLTFTTNQLKGFIGIAVLLAVLGSVAIPPIPLSRTTLFTGGAVQGTTGTAAGIGGPPLALLYQRHEGPVMRSTLAASFLFGTMLSTAVLAVTGEMPLHSVALAAVLTPVVIAGSWVGRRLAPQLDRGWLRPAVLGFAALSALVVLVDALR